MAAAAAAAAMWRRRRGGGGGPPGSLSCHDARPLCVRLPGSRPQVLLGYQSSTLVWVRRRRSAAGSCSLPTFHASQSTSATPLGRATMLGRSTALLLLGLLVCCCLPPAAARPRVTPAFGALFAFHNDRCELRPARGWLASPPPTLPPAPPPPALKSRLSLSPLAAACGTFWTSPTGTSAWKARCCPRCGVPAGTSAAESREGRR